MLPLRQKLKLCGFAIGIFGSFAIFGLLQEKILRGRYGDEIGADGKVGERYTMPITFVAIQCIFFTLFAKALTYTHNHPKNETSQGFYALTGIFYVLGKVTSHMSLQWVPYPTQIVGKSLCATHFVSRFLRQIFSYMLVGESEKIVPFQQTINFCGCAIGIFGCFSIFGLLQEQIFSGRYGDEINADGTVGKRYTMPIAFGAAQCIFSVLFAKALMFTHDHPKNETSQGFYLLIGLLTTVGSVTTTMSLQWISYLTQLVGKSCKPIPVMILGVIIGRKRYSCRKVIFVLTIVMGVLLFIFKDKYTEKDGEDPLRGNLLIATSLLMDGLCGATEDRMRSVSKPAPLNFMMYMNFWSSIFLVTGVLVFGEAPKVYAFVLKYPEILKYFAMAVVVASFGQIFISSMISNFGPLALSLTTTTRKFFSVCLSVIIFGNHLSHRQWGAASLIFGALIVDALLNKPKKNVEAEPENPVTEITVITRTESDGNKNDDTEPEIQGIYVKKVEE